MNLGAKLLTQASGKSEANAGDGTTSTAVLTQEMVNQGLQLVVSGYNPVLMQRGMKTAAIAVADEIKRLAKHVETSDLLDIATVSVGGDRAMGANIAEAFQNVGDTGNVVIEESQMLMDEMETTEGMTLDRGFVSPYFVTDEQRLVAELNQPRILVTDHKLTDANELLNFLVAFVKEKRPLLIVAEDISSTALQTLVLNKQRGIIDVVAIKAPAFGARKTAILQDIALATGAEFISSDLGMSIADVTPDKLGTCERVVAEKDKTILVSDGSQDAVVRARITQLSSEAASATSVYEAEKLQERISALGGGVAKIKVGGATETEVNDKKLRYTDAINAVRSAKEMGIIPGGGSSLVYLSRPEFADSVKSTVATVDEQMGAQLVFKSLVAPARQIAMNGGDDASEVLFKIRGQPFGFGFNAATQRFEDLMKAGVVDPAKVVYNAVVNAASIAGMVITTDAVVTQIPDGPGADAAAMMNGMGGMMGGMGGMGGMM